jgi:hypothetical protein
MGGVTVDRNGIAKMAPQPRQITADRTKENNKEFGIAAKQARVIRSALAPLQIASRLLPSRLTKQVREGISLDNSNARGKRILSKREATIVLPGFQISEVGTLESIGNLIATVINGQLTVQKVGGENLTKPDFRIPEGATDIQIAALVARVNINPSVLQVLDIQTTLSTENQNGEIVLPPVPVVSNQNADVITIAAVAVRFFQEVNGLLYPLSNRSFDVGKIIAVV